MSEKIIQSKDDDSLEAKRYSTHANRRQVLTGVVATGAVVATALHNPIVKAVMLPAHAQTSAVTDDEAQIIDFLLRLPALQKRVALAKFY